MNNRILRLALVAVAMLGGASVAKGQSVTVTFPTSTSFVTASTGSISSTEIGYFWSVSRGDQVSQAYAGTGLFGVSSLSMDLNVTRNLLNSGAHVDWDVLVNGVDVGDWSWSDLSGTGLTNISLTFAPISGEFSSLALVVTNEVPFGGGSIALGLDTSATVTAAIPEPETYAMLLAGLGLLGFAAHRRKQKELAT